MPSYTAGTAFLRIAPSLRGLHNEINRELRSITPEPVVKVRIQPEWRQGTPIPRPPVQDTEVIVPVRAQVDRKSFADATNQVALLQRSIVQIAKPVAAAFAIPAVVGFASAVEAASRSILLVPGVVAVAGAATAAYKVGVMGLADAFKAVKDGDPEKIAEAMAKLSPNARSLVTEVVRIGPAFKSMQLEVQETLLRRIGVEFSALAMKYLPTVRTGLVDTAKWMNVWGLTTMEALSNARSVGSVKLIFSNTSLVMKELSETGADLTNIFLDMAAVGSTFLPTLAASLGDAAERARDFIANARDTGMLRIWIESGINAVRDWTKIFVNLGATINNVMDAAGLDNFLGKTVEITQKMRDWSESANGVAQTRDLFSSLSDLGASLAPKIVTIAGTIIKIISAVGPAIKPLAEGVTDVVIAAGPAVELFTTLAVSILPPLGAALSFLAPVLGPVVAAFLAGAVAVKAWGVVTGLASLATRGFAVVMGVARAVQFGWMVITNLMVARLVVLTAATWLWNAAMSANPLGIVVIAIMALVAAVVLAWHHSETFRNIVIGAWEAIKTAAIAVWGWLTDVIFPSFIQAVTDVGNFFVTLWTDYIQPAWEAIKVGFTVGWEAIKVAFQVAGDVIVAVWNFIVEAAKLAFVIIATVVLTPLMIIWNAVSEQFMIAYHTWIKPAWDAITTAISAAWGFIEPIFAVIQMWVEIKLAQAQVIFQQTVSTVWTAIQTTINTVWTFIRDYIWQPIVDFVNNFLVPGALFWRDIAVATWEEIRAAIDTAWQWILNNIWQPLVDYINVTIVPTTNFLGAEISRIWNEIQTVIDTVWTFIRDNIWNPLVEFITVTIPNGFQAGVDAVGRLWDGIKAKLRDPLQAAIDVVWNNGIVKVWNMVADLVGLGTKLSPYNLPGFAEGGAISGGKPGKDSVLLRAMPGEYILSKKAVDGMGGVGAVDMLHRLFRQGGSPKARPDKFLPGYQTGGPVQPAAGPFALIGDIWGALTGAISGISGAIQGAGEWGGAVIGFGKKIGQAVLDHLQAKVAAFLAQFVGIGGGAGGGSMATGSGQVAAMMSALRAVFPGLGLISGARPGAITATGNRSYHSMGRAVDIPPNMAVFNWIRQNYPNSRELIFSPAGGAQIHNGRPHVYSGVTRSMHYDHIHWAMDQGGIANGKGLMAKGIIKPERVLSNRQTMAFETLVAALDRQAGTSRVLSDRGDVDAAQPLGSGSFIGQLVVSPQPGESIEHVLDTAMVRARHEFHSGRYGRR